MTTPKLTIKDVLPGASPEFLTAWLRLDELCAAHSVAQAHQNVTWAALTKESTSGGTAEAWYLEKCEKLQEAVSERDLMVLHVKRLLVAEDSQTRYTLDNDLARLLVEMKAKL